MSNTTTIIPSLPHIDVQTEISNLIKIISDSKIITHHRISHRKDAKRPRKPRKENQITPSNLRPHVLASERILKWSTPQSTTFKKSLAFTYPRLDPTRSFEVMFLSLDEATRSGYGSGLLRFTQFCDNHRIPETSRMPASESLLVLFAADAAGQISPSTLNTWLAGLHFWHIVNGATWHGGERLTQIRKGVRKLTPTTSKRKKRPPVTAEHLYALRRGLDLTNSFDASVWAVACVAFWSCCRLGELLIPSPNAFDPVKHAARGADLTFGSINDTNYASLHIPWTKTTGVEGAIISITSRDDPSCPLAALEHHLQCNRDIPASAPFFSYRTGAGSWSPMTKGWFLMRCNQIWSAVGLAEMPGHGFRIGGATHLLLSGVPPDVVAVQGRWLSRAFLEYWRRVESILPLFISKAGVASRIEALSSAMDTYRRKHKL
jgi:hypothetical protein